MSVRRVSRLNSPSSNGLLHVHNWTDSITLLVFVFCKPSWCLYHADSICSRSRVTMMVNVVSSLVNDLMMQLGLLIVFFFMWIANSCFPRWQTISIFPTYNSCWFSIILIQVIELIFLLNLILKLLLVVCAMDSSLTMLAHWNVLLIWVSWAITRWNILLNVNIFVLTGDSI